MKLPYLDDSTVRSLSGQAAKVLIFLASSRPIGAAIRMTCVDAAVICKMCPDTWRSAVRELAAAGVVDATSTTAGYLVKVRGGDRRFTWLPSLSDHLWMHVSPRGCRVALAIARVATNRVNSARIKIRTISERLDLSRRTVQLALAELTGRMILTSHRTPRSSWYIFVKQEQPELFEGRVAPHWKMCMRLLYSYPVEFLTKRLPSLIRVDKQKAQLVREHVIGHRQMTDQDRRWRQAMHKQHGVDWDEATCMALEYTESERRRATSLLIGRRPRDVTAWLWAALERGWCGA